MSHSSYITVDRGLRGWFAVHVEDGMPVQSGIGSFETYEEAAEEAKDWGLADGLPVRVEEAKDA